MKPRYEKRSHWKPTRRDWVLAAVLIPTGVVGLLISWWSEQLPLQGLAATALAVGIGYGVGTALRLNIYRNLSPEEQRKADRAQHDERNLLIEAKATVATATVLFAVLCGLCIAFSALDRGGEAALCLGILILAGLVYYGTRAWFRHKL